MKNKKYNTFDKIFYENTQTHIQLPRRIRVLKCLDGNEAIFEAMVALARMIPGAKIIRDKQANIAGTK